MFNFDSKLKKQIKYFFYNYATVCIDIWKVFPVVFGIEKNPSVGISSFAAVDGLGTVCGVDS